MKNTSMRALLGLSTALALGAGSAVAQDIKVGHLTYHTGEYGGFGEFFDAVTDMSLEVINAYILDQISSQTSPTIVLL